MNKHRKDSKALFEAYQQIQQVDEGIFGRMGNKIQKNLGLTKSQRAAGAAGVDMDTDAKKMSTNFAAALKTLAPGSKTITKQMLNNFLVGQHQKIQPDSLQSVASLPDPVKVSDVQKALPQIIRDVHSQFSFGVQQPDIAPATPEWTFDDKELPGGTPDTDNQTGSSEAGASDVSSIVDQINSLSPEDKQQILTTLQSEPAAEQPAVEEPAPEQPAVEEPEEDEPAAEQPAVEEPAPEQPAVEEPAVEEPAVEEPAAEQPAVEEPIAPVKQNPNAERMNQIKNVAMKMVRGQGFDVSAEDKALVNSIKDDLKARVEGNPNQPQYRIGGGVRVSNKQAQALINSGNIYDAIPILEDIFISKSILKRPGFTSIDWGRF